MVTAEQDPSPETPPLEEPWYAGEVGWQPISRAFIRRELSKPDPDYRSLAEQLADYSPAERHAAWIEVAQQEPSRLGRTRAYVEAIHNDPDPTSVAWGWLDGDFDLADSVEHVVGDGDQRAAPTVAAVRARLGSIVDAGRRDAVGATSQPIAQPQIPQPQIPQPQIPQPQIPQPQIPQPPAPRSLDPWSPTHVVPAGGMAAWDYPDPARRAVVVLGAGLGVVIDETAGDWALVRAVNGWRGWVDGRRLTRRF